MSNILTQAQFLKRFAKSSNVLQKDAKQYLAIIKDEITRSLAKGYAVNITGFGTLKRAKFPSKMMPNPNDRSKKTLVLERYYMRIKPSRNLKTNIKHKLFPDKYKAQETPITITESKTTKEHKVNINRSFNIPIHIKPHIPEVKWRNSLSPQILDLRRANPDAGDRLLKNLFRRIDTPSVRSISISPNDITYYDKVRNTEKISDILYQQILANFKKRLPQTFTYPQAWRLLSILPPRRTYNFSILPESDDGWLINISKPTISHSPIENTAGLPPQTQKVIDTLMASGSGKILITGNPDSRRVSFEKIKQYLDSQSATYHTAVEYHRYPTHPHINLPSHLKRILPQVNKHNTLLIDSLSGADNFYHLRDYPGLIVASTTLSDIETAKRIINLQQLPEGFFTDIIESHLFDAPCSKCAPQYTPAVRFPHLRRIASSRGNLLHVHPVKIKTCSHKEAPVLIHVHHSGQANQNLENQLYDMALRHEIDYDTMNKTL